jgi:VIT family protein
MNAGKPRLLRIGLRGGRRSTNRVGHAVYNVVPEPGLVPVPLPQPSIEKQSWGTVTMSDSSDQPSVHVSEPNGGGVGQKLNWLRAGVLGANDGIVSTAGLVVEVAAATPHIGPILTAGVAGFVAGAVSMALG